jgi:hypothetical protein
VHSEGKVLDNEICIIGVFLEQLLKFRKNPAAVRSLVVQEGIDRNGSTCFPDDR